MPKFSSCCPLFLMTMVIVMFAAPAVFADPIIINGGTVYFASVGLGYDPPFGFQLTGERTQIGGITYTQGGQSFLNVGDVVNLGSSLSVSSTLNSGPFEQVVNGVHLTDVILRGSLHFAAAPVRFNGDMSRGITAPFTMDGQLSFFRYDPHQDGELLLTASVSGRGTASLGMYPLTDFFRATFTTYTFRADPPTPAPEPGTLALFGSGLIAAIARSRRKREARDRGK